MPIDFRMAYPIIKEEYKKIYDICPVIQTSMLGDFDEALRKLNDNFFINLFKEAVDCANKYNVPLYCGEYGIIDRAEPKSTLNWLKDINKAFEYYGIGRALWSYKKMDFGIIDDHYKDIYDEMIKYL